MDAIDLATQPPARHDASYELIAHLATGGMAELFIARRHGDRSAPYVVLKRVMPEQARNPHFVGMFLDEARLASRLNHPNIAQVLDVGRAGSSYYYTMEYVHGENVRDLLQLAVKQQVMVPLDVCLSILIGAATGLHAAHETRDRHGKHLGIVHRDVSPSNVMIGYDGEIKLVDFGVAKAADHTMETQSGTVKGKIAYLSPEQCTVQPVDRRSDVFSLGIVAFELVTRSRLFRRRSDYETMHAIVNDPVPPPSRLRPGVPPTVDAVIQRALNRMPERRPQSTAVMADELAAVAAGLGLAVGAPVLARFMAELFGGKPLPWTHLEHHDTAVIELAALAPGLVPSEREPLEASVSAAEVVIEVDHALSSSVDQAFAAVKTTIAPPPREWGVGEEVPGVFTWPSRDEGVESVDRTVMTSSPPRRTALDPPRVAATLARVPIGTGPLPPVRDGAGAGAGPAFLPTDTVVTPPDEAARKVAGGTPAFPTARTETGAAPAPAPSAARRSSTPGSEPAAASTMKFGKVGWLDEVATTIADRTSTQRKVAAAAGTAAAATTPAAAPRAESPDNPGPRDTVLDLREGPPGMAVDLAELRRLAGLAGSPPSAKPAKAPVAAPAARQVIPTIAPLAAAPPAARPATTSPAPVASVAKPAAVTVMLPPGSKAATAKAAATARAAVSPAAGAAVSPAAGAAVSPAAGAALDATIDDRLDATLDAELTGEGVTSDDLDTHRVAAMEEPDPFDHRTTAPRAITRPPPTDPSILAMAAPTELVVQAIPRPTVAARAPAPVVDSNPRIAPPVRTPDSDPRIAPPVRTPDSNPRLSPPRTHDSSPRAPVPPAAVDSGPRPSIAARKDDSSPRVAMPPSAHDSGLRPPAPARKDDSSPRVAMPPSAQGSGLRPPAPARKDDSSPRVPMPPPGHDSSPRVPMPPPGHDSSPRVPMPPPGHDSSPRVLLPPQHDRNPPGWPPRHHGTGPNPLIPAAGVMPGASSTRRALIVVGLGAMCGGAIAIGATLALRPPPRPEAPAPPTEPPVAAPEVTAADVAAFRTRAAAAGTAGNWELAYNLCREGLRLAPGDVELTATCAHAACVARNPQAAGLYLRRLPAAEVAAVRRRCLEVGVADPTRP